MSVPRGDARSLDQQFRPGLLASVAAVLVAFARSLWALVRELSPVHYEPGDMRREYRWTRAALAGAATTLCVALAVRSVLTGLFVAYFSAEPSLVTLFNVGLSAAVLGGGGVLAAVRAVDVDRFRDRGGL